MRDDVYEKFAIEFYPIMKNACEGVNPNDTEKFKDGTYGIHTLKNKYCTNQAGQGYPVYYNKKKLATEQNKKSLFDLIKMLPKFRTTNGNLFLNFDLLMPKNSQTEKEKLTQALLIESFLIYIEECELAIFKFVQMENTKIISARLNSNIVDKLKQEGPSPDEK